MDPLDEAARALRDEGWNPREPGGHIGHVGPLWTRREQQDWAYGLLAGARHLNPAGLVHGGAIATLIDHAMSTVGWEARGRQPCITVQMSIQYLAAAREGDFLAARARVVRSASSLLFVSGSVSCGATEVASASAVLKVLASKGQGPA